MATEEPRVKRNLTPKNRIKLQKTLDQKISDKLKEVQLSKADKTLGFSYNPATGVIILVTPNSKAESQGIEVGDVLFVINKQRFDTYTDPKFTLSMVRPLTIYFAKSEDAIEYYNFTNAPRSRQIQIISRAAVVIAEKEHAGTGLKPLANVPSANVPLTEEDISTRNERKIALLDIGLSQKTVIFNETPIGINYDEDKGVIIRIREGSPAKKEGLEPGDVLENINGKKFNNYKYHELREVISKAPVRITYIPYKDAVFLYTVTNKQIALDHIRDIRANAGFANGYASANNAARVAARKEDALALRMLKKSRSNLGQGASRKNLVADTTRRIYHLSMKLNIGNSMRSRLVSSAYKLMKLPVPSAEELNEIEAHILFGPPGPKPEGSAVLGSAVPRAAVLGSAVPGSAVPRAAAPNAAAVQGATVQGADVPEEQVENFNSKNNVATMTRKIRNGRIIVERHIEKLIKATRQLRELLDAVKAANRPPAPEGSEWLGGFRRRILRKSRKTRRSRNYRR